MKNEGCYNTDAAFWATFFEAEPGARLTFENGAVIGEGMDVFAVFPDNEAACVTVERARASARARADAERAAAAKRRPA